MTGTWYPPSLGTGGVLIEAQLFTNPPFKMTEHDPTGRSAHEPTPPTELIITTEPEFPGQVVWVCNGTLGIAPDEATARADAAALAQPEPEGRPAPAPGDRGVLPMIVTETGADDEPEIERITCASISGGADYVNNMPRELSLERTTPQGSIFARYIQVDAGTRFGGRPAPAPAWEVEHAASIRRMCDIILGNTFGNEELDSLALLVGHHPDVLNASPAAEGEVAELINELRRICFDVAPCDADTITRAADLLEQRQAAPVAVAVSERLPGAEERGSDECCWWFHPETDDTLPVWVFGYGNDEWERENPPSPTHWLPAHALPLPSCSPIHHSHR